MNRKKNQKKNHSKLYVIEAVIVIGLALGAWIFTMARSAGKIVNTENALEIDGEKYSVSDVNYFYYAYYDSYCEQNAEYISYMFDADKSLKEQEYEDGVSWFSYFLEESIKSMVNVAEVSKAAGEDGFELDTESEAQIQEYLDGVSLAAENSGITADEYVARIYGEDMTLKRYEELMKMSFTARDYTVAKQEGYTCTDDEIEKYYQENQQAYDFASYERLYFRAGSQEQEPSDEERNEAESQAKEALEKVKDGGELKEVAEDYEDAVYYATDDAYYSAGYSYGNWLFLEDRKPGDCTLIDDGNGFYVMVFHDRSRHDYETVNVRDIYFAVDTASEDLDEAYEESCIKAEEVYEEWKDGGGTEELFAALADKNTSAEGLDGGLYEELSRGSLDTSVEKWCFEKDHKAGDCEVIYAENGFHVLYFAGYGTPAWKIEVEEDIREARLSAWLDELMESAQVDRHEKALENAAGL